MRVEDERNCRIAYLHSLHQHSVEAAPAWSPGLLVNLTSSFSPDETIDLPGTHWSRSCQTPPAFGAAHQSTPALTTVMITLPYPELSA